MSRIAQDSESTPGSLSSWRSKTESNHHLTWIRFSENTGTMDYFQLKVVTVDSRNPKPLDMDNINIPLFILISYPTKWFLAGSFSMNSMSGSHQLKLHIRSLTKRPSGYAIIRATPLVMTQIKQKSPTPSMPWTLKRRLRRYNGNIRQQKLGLLFRVTTKSTTMEGAQQKKCLQFNKRAFSMPNMGYHGKLALPETANYCANLWQSYSGVQKPMTLHFSN